MRTSDELSLFQRLRLRWNDRRLLRQLRKVRALLVSFGLDPSDADDKVVEIIRGVPVLAFDRLPTSEGQRHRDRVMGLWLADRGARS